MSFETLEFEDLSATRLTATSAGKRTFLILSLTIERAAYPQAGFGHHVRVDHRTGDIAVAERFLHATNVRAGFQEMRGKAVPQGMAARRLSKVSQYTA